MPYVSKLVAGIAAFLNVFLPGIGTMITACAGSGVVSKTQLIVGLLQFFTAYILIGYIWSWYWAYLIVMKAMDPRGMQANPAGVSNMANNPNYAANPVGYDNDPSGFGNNR